ncbi:MAG: DUF559 domain-containing protein [Clostridia bacterium]|nr:DUF559 domain-containing protein [Clostridia bacterium]
MKRKHNPTLTPNARALRKAMTPQEKQLWYGFLWGYPIPILRQKVIDRFIVDFFCSKARLVIEIDGSQHDRKQGVAHDFERTQYLQGYGLTVLRFANTAVDADYENVCNTIDKVIGQLLRTEKNSNPDLLP